MGYKNNMIDATTSSLSSGLFRYPGRLWRTLKLVRPCGFLTTQPAPAWGVIHSSGLADGNITAGLY